VGAPDLTTDGYFAQAARPTTDAIIARASIFDFRCDFMACLKTHNIGGHVVKSHL